MNMQIYKAITSSSSSHQFYSTPNYCLLCDVLHFLLLVVEKGGSKLGEGTAVLERISSVKLIITEYSQ
jgi:hypothetical protein|uniref:Uncharacterized protein n=1 Tax=Populus trichocarpa TaxID=3694 RepID=A0A2K2C549_POPTR